MRSALRPLLSVGAQAGPSRAAFSTSAPASGILTKRQRARGRPKRDETLYGIPERRDLAELEALGVGLGEYDPKAPHPLWQFFHVGEPINVAAPPVNRQTHDSGRAWLALELRRKSFADLHQLWFILMKERNVLLTQRHEFKRLRVPIGSTYVPRRLAKVGASMGRIKAVLNERRLAYAEAIKILHAQDIQSRHPQMTLDDPVFQRVLHDTWLDAEEVRQRREAYLGERDGLTEAAAATEPSAEVSVPAVVESASASGDAQAATGEALVPVVASEPAAVDTPIEPEPEASPLPQPARVDPRIAKLRAMAAAMLPPSLPKLAIDGSRRSRKELSVDALKERYEARRQAQAISMARAAKRADVRRRAAKLVGMGASSSSGPSARL